jgi:hypothetical protein
VWFVGAGFQYKMLDEVLLILSESRFFTIHAINDLHDDHAEPSQTERDPPSIDELDGKQFDRRVMTGQSVREFLRNDSEPTNFKIIRGRFGQYGDFYSISRQPAVANDSVVGTGNLFRKHADKEGYVQTHLVLKPSRAPALSDPAVQRYSTGEIVSKPLRFKITPTPVDEKL